MKPFVWPTALAMELKDWVTSFASSDLAKFKCQPFAGNLDNLVQWLKMGEDG